MIVAALVWRRLTTSFQHGLDDREPAARVSQLTPEDEKFGIGVCSCRRYPPK